MAAIPEKSLVIQLIAYIEEVFVAVDSGYFETAAYFDFVKFFCSVPHPRLITKLYKFGLIQDFVKLVPSYPFNSNERVPVRQHVGNTMLISIGVPEGSILDAFLFVSYIDDISNCNDRPINFYAYDTKHVTQKYDNFHQPTASF